MIAAVLAVVLSCNCPCARDPGASMEKASDLAVAETNAKLCRREAEVTMQDARSLCEKRRRALEKLREEMRAAMEETSDAR